MAKRFAARMAIASFVLIAVCLLTGDHSPAVWSFLGLAAIITAAGYGFVAAKKFQGFAPFGTVIWAAIALMIFSKMLP
ncbi:hypothetical protein KW786_02455 [Candidatus Parcubacteria bacterium]|nr:hypothetical protein [Candidatus Parcubacteria bacterium]